MFDEVYLAHITITLMVLQSSVRVKVFVELGLVSKIPAYLSYSLP